MCMHTLSFICLKYINIAGIFVGKRLCFGSFFVKIIINVGVACNPYSCSHELSCYIVLTSGGMSSPYQQWQME